MRFLIKIAFLIGLIALFLPGRQEKGEGTDPGLSPVVLLYGVQQAFSDLGSFCDRSPAACATARDAASFVGHRIAEGAAIGYNLAREKIGGEPASRPVAPPDNPAAPRAYTPPGEHRPVGGLTTGAVKPGASAPPSLVPTAFAPVERPSPLSSSPLSSMPLSSAPAERKANPAQPQASAPHLPQPYRQPVPARSKSTTASAPNAETASAEPSAPVLDHVPGSPKPFRMPAMAGGAREAAHPLPQSVLPPERAPLPRFAPRA